MKVSPWLRYHTRVIPSLKEAVEYIKTSGLHVRSIYLCGGINGLSDSDCKDWREYVKQRLPDTRLIDPMRRDYRGREDESVTEIILGDKEDIRYSDVILVNATRPSWGTAMEIIYGFERSKTIISFMSL